MVRHLLSLVLLIPTIVFAQSEQEESRTSTIRGRVIDERSQQPIERARIALKGSKLGAMSNRLGEYRIEKVPVGHYVLLVSAPGFEMVSSEVIVGSARQAVIDFSLRERVVQGDSVTVSGALALSAINPVAT